MSVSEKSLKSFNMYFCLKRGTFNLVLPSKPFSQGILKGDLNGSKVWINAA